MSILPAVDWQRNVAQLGGGVIPADRPTRHTRSMLSGHPVNFACFYRFCGRMAQHEAWESTVAGK